MTTNFKNYSLDTLADADTVIYTVPATTTAIVISVLATNTSSAADSISLGVRKLGSETTTWAASNISLAIDSSVNLLAGKIGMEAGDSLRVRHHTANPWQYFTADRKRILGGGSLCNHVLSNADASILCGVVNTKGIFTSTDGGLTATRTLGENFSSNTACYFGGAFHIYVSATSKYTSTDGVNWSTVAVTNAPTVKANSFGGIIIKGGQLFGLGTSTQMVTSTDGITWTNYGVALPAACSSLCWTGTNFVLGNNAGNGNIYYSAAAASWTTVLVLASASLAWLDCVGGTVLASVSNNGTIYRSTNHGAAFASVPLPYNLTKFTSTGSAFIATNYPYCYTSADGLSWSNPVQGAEGLINPLSALAIANGKVWGDSGRTVDLLCTANQGISVVASVVEAA